MVIHNLYENGAVKFTYCALKWLHSVSLFVVLGPRQFRKESLRVTKAESVVLLFKDFNKVDTCSYIRDMRGLYLCGTAHKQMVYHNQIKILQLNRVF